jgi:hypothetical protein
MLGNNLKILWFLWFCRLFCVDSCVLFIFSCGYISLADVAGRLLGQIVAHKKADALHRLFVLRHGPQMTLTR